MELPLEELYRRQTIDLELLFKTLIGRSQIINQKRWFLIIQTGSQRISLLKLIN